MLLLRDFRHGARLLARHPSFAAAALAVMALGIGATTAVFTVVRAVLLRPLPYRAPDRLVLFRADGPGVAHQALLTGHELAAIRTRPDIFESIAVINQSEGNLTTPREMDAVTAASPSDNFLETLGVGPMLGRMVSLRDIGTQWMTGVDISYELWQQRWYGDPAIVGRQIEVNNIPVTIVGVLPSGFRLHLGPGVPVTPRLDMFFPRGPGYDEGPTRSQTVLARLRSGVKSDAAQSAVDALTRTLTATRPSDYHTGAVRLTVSPLEDEVTSDVKPALVTLTGAVAFVLLIACANLMNLLLARATARTRELATRAAIGASRGRLVAQLAAESVLLGAAGAALGLLVARWGVDTLLRFAPDTLPRRETIAIDAAVALFAAGTSLACSLVFGLIPAWQATRTDIVDMMKQDPAAPRHASVTRGLLVAAQIALSLVLLVGAGLMARAFTGMRSVPLGFEPRGAMTMNVHLQVQRFNDGGIDESREKRLAFYRELARSVRDIPGVQQVGIGCSCR
jgi:predicted permease